MTWLVSFVGSAVVEKSMSIQEKRISVTLLIGKSKSFYAYYLIPLQNLLTNIMSHIMSL